MKTRLVEPRRPLLRNLAWLAGLYEGEGSCSIVRRYSNRPAARIHLASTDHDVIVRVRRITAMGTVSTYHRPKTTTISYKKRPKPIYTWEVSRRDHVKQLIMWLLSFAGKRRRARLMEARKLKPTPCKAGRHLLTKNNIGRWSDGCVKCLGCERDRRRKARA